ncbi:hypothetical protein [Streptosporangium sp. NPDC006007]|uniref:hypothetical protein n=1 Tax=Streptosporangium sp. NPDC006007 TaxID=3154575 RepID=UPI00339E705E
MTASAPTGPPDPCGRGIAVDNLRSLAQEDRLRCRAAQLAKLANDLEARNNLERWAEVDVYAAFIRDDTVEPRRRSALGGVLDLAPSVLIFLPIVTTWIGLFAATDAYRRSRGDQALRAMSFLEQWQTGFHGRLDGALYFDRIALWTLLAVGLLVSVSLAQALSRRRTEHADEQERRQLLGKLATALTAADFQLSEFRMNDASRLNTGAEGLLKATVEVQKAGDAAKLTQIEAHEGLKEVRTSLNRVKELAEAMLQSEDSVRSAAERMGDAATGIGAKLDEISAVTGAVATAAADLSRSTSADSDKLRDSVQQVVADSAKEIRAAVTESRRDLSTSISGALDTTGTGIRRALDDWRTEGAIYSHRHETTADHLGLIMGSIEQLMDRLAKSVDWLPTSVERLERNVDGASTRLEQVLTETSERLKRQIDRLLVGLPAADSRTDRVVVELTALRGSIDQLRGQLGSLSVERPTRRWWWF